MILFAEFNKYIHMEVLLYAWLLLMVVSLAQDIFIPYVFPVADILSKMLYCLLFIKNIQSPDGSQSSLMKNMVPDH